MPTQKKGNRWKTDFGLNKQRYVKYFNTKEEGEAWENLVRYLVGQGRSVEEIAPQPREAMTVGDAENLALEHWKGTKNELNAAANARDIVKFFGPSTLVTDLTQDSLDSLVKYLRNREHPSSKGRQSEPLSNATLNRKLAALSTMLRLAREKGEHVKITIKQFKESEGRIRFLTRDEEETATRLLGEHKGQKLADFVTFAVETGGRLSEMLELRGKHINERQDGVFLTFPGEFTKSGKTRTIPLTKKALEIVQKYMPADRNDKLWPEDWNKYTITHAWAFVRGKMGLKDDNEFVFHACRHTCATRLLEVTGNLELVRVWLGHSDIRVTTRYAKVVSSSLLGAAAALNFQPTQQ